MPLFTINSSKDQSPSSLPPPHTPSHTRTHTHTHQCTHALCNTKQKTSQSRKAKFITRFLAAIKIPRESLPLPRSTIRVIYNTSNLLVARVLLIANIFFPLPSFSSFLLSLSLSLFFSPSTLLITHMPGKFKSPGLHRLSSPSLTPSAAWKEGEGVEEEEWGKTEGGGWQVTRETRRNEKSLPSPLPLDGMHSIIQFTVANDGV